jgi:N-acetylglutamate synthase-like GNAT family acetyltransferase
VDIRILIKNLQNEDYLIDTNKNKLQMDVIHSYLSRSYWSAGIAQTLVEKSIKHSFCFGVYCHNEQVGFARLITDYCSFAYLADVFILEEHRGKGLSKWLMHVIVNHPDLQTLRRWNLTTADAHGLYKQFGFTALKKPDVYMEMHFPDRYKAETL